MVEFIDERAAVTAARITSWSPLTAPLAGWRVLSQLSFILRRIILYVFNTNHFCVSFTALNFNDVACNGRISSTLAAHDTAVNCRRLSDNRSRVERTLITSKVLTTATSVRTTRSTMAIMTAMTMMMMKMRNSLQMSRATRRRRKSFHLVCLRVDVVLFVCCYCALNHSLHLQWRRNRCQRRSLPGPWTRRKLLRHRLQRRRRRRRRRRRQRRQRRHRLK